MSVADGDGIDDSIASADLGLSSTCPIEGATGSVPLLPPSSLKPKSLSSAFLTRFGRAFLVSHSRPSPNPSLPGCVDDKSRSTATELHRRFVLWKFHDGWQSQSSDGVLLST